MADNEKLRTHINRVRSARGGGRAGRLHAQGDPHVQGAEDGLQPDPGAAADGPAKNDLKSDPGKTNGGSRPSVVPISYPDRASLQKAYMPFVKGGGLFLPTSVGYELHEEIFLLVTLPNSDKPMTVPGRVVWKSPDNGMGGRRQGVGIEFQGREANGLRNQIEGVLGAKISSATETYTM